MKIFLENPPATNARAETAASLGITRDYQETFKTCRVGRDPQSTMTLAGEVWCPDLLVGPR